MTTVTGILRDAQQNAIPDAGVTVRYTRALVGFDGGAVAQNDRLFTTDGSGLLTMTGLIPGHYDVSVFMPTNANTTETVIKRGIGTVPTGVATLTWEAFLSEPVGTVDSTVLQQAIAAKGDAEAAAAAAEAAAASVEFPVSYAPQSLNTGQQAQARDNIGAAANTAAQGFHAPPTQAQLDALPASVFRVWFLDDGKSTALVRSPGADKLPDQLGWMPDVEPALYDQGAYLANYAGPEEWWDGLCDDIVDSTAKIYAAFDAMQTADPDYVTSSVIGTDDAGNEIRQYTFFDNRMRLGSGWDGAKVKTPEICIIAGIHGNETEAILATIHLAQQLVFHARFDDEAMRLRLGVKFRFVPAAVPTAINARQRRKPVGDVDINRNFPSQWFDADISPGSKGSAPASEIETQIAMTLPDLFPDCDVFLDFHSHVLGSTYNQWMGVFDARDRDLAISHMREFLQRQLDYGETYPPTDFLVSVGTAGGLVRHYNLAFGRKAILLEVWRDSREWTDLRRMKLFRLEWVKSFCMKLMRRVNVDRQTVGNVAIANTADPLGLRNNNPNEYTRVFGDVPGMSVLIAPEFADNKHALNLARPFDTMLEDYQREIEYADFPNNALAFDARFNTPDRRRFIPLQGGVDLESWTVFAVCLPESSGAHRIVRPNQAVNDAESGLFLNIGFLSDGTSLRVWEDGRTTGSAQVRLQAEPTTPLPLRSTPTLLMYTFSTQRGLRIFDGGEEVAVNENDTRPLTKMLNPGQLTWFHNFEGRMGAAGLINTDLSAPENALHFNQVTDFLLAKYGIPAGSQ